MRLVTVHAPSRRSCYCYRIELPLWGRVQDGTIRTPFREAVLPDSGVNCQRHVVFTHQVNTTVSNYSPLVSTIGLKS